MLAVDSGEHDYGACRRIVGAGKGDPARLPLLPDPLQVGWAMRLPALEHVRHVFVQKHVVNVWFCHRPQPTAAVHRDSAVPLVSMSNLDRRGGYTPRRAREQRAYRLVVIGGTAGAVGVVSLVFAIVGVIGLTLPVLALIVAAICFVLFQRATGKR